MNTHTWTFLSGQSTADAPVLIAVCSRCGLVRTSQIPNRLSERHIGLGGECPGEPQLQEAIGRASKRSDMA